MAIRVIVVVPSPFNSSDPSANLCVPTTFPAIKVDVSDVMKNTTNDRTMSNEIFIVFLIALFSSIVNPFRWLVIAMPDIKIDTA